MLMSRSTITILLLLAANKTMTASYSIGTPAKPWGSAEIAEWRTSRAIHRSYHDEVVRKLNALRDRSCFEVGQYGSLSQDPERYPLYYVKTRDWKEGRPCVLITGGVHGYEMSGVQGALEFLATRAEAHGRNFNILVAPCVSPWGYETIQRWTCHAVDPNRSFNPDGEIAPVEESRALIDLLENLQRDHNIERWTCHLDLHETTDTDESEFRPARDARDGITDSTGAPIPDGFYLVSDSTRAQPEWNAAMIEAVRKVTHIAPPDADGTMIGETVVQEGVIAIPSPRSLGLCAGVTNAEFATTTEVYPDSPRATGTICNRAQIACIEAALKFILDSA